MDKWIDLIKALVRPFIIFFGWPVYGICVANEVEVPLLFTAILAAFTIEYGGERAIKRLREK